MHNCIYCLFCPADKILLGVVIVHKVAVLGFGTVGSGVVEALDINSGAIGEKTDGIEVKYIVDVRDFPDSPYGGLVVKDFSAVENDPEVDIVVETIGGTGVAYGFTKRSLAAGKSVVTSNKELVATHGYELMELAEKHGVSYLFEASVAGGVPLLRPMVTCLNADRITEVYGILNGTTNYVLTQMFKHGVSFSAALAKAQKLGYSELNPTADIDGHDACRKVCILASLVTGTHVSQEKVPAEGISGVSIEDVENAGMLGYTIKLLGRAVFSGGKVYAYVAPHLVKNTEMLSGVEDVMNGVVVRGNIVGEVMFYGPGAGKLPTASAVVSDIIDAACDSHAGDRYSWGAPDDTVTGDPEELASKWYVRLSGKQEDMEEKLPGSKLIGSRDDKYACYTEEMTAKELHAALEGATVLSAFRIIG